MENEQTRALKILQLAVGMEEDGKKFYRKASRESSNKLTKELFKELAKQEEIHRKKFEEIYKILKRGQNWPDVESESKKGANIKSLFAEATKALGREFRIAESEFEAINTAIDMEIRSYNLYHSLSAESTLPVEKQFYKTLAGEERGHHLALLDSYEYLSDPAGWFTRKEHWSLDGA